MLVLTYKNKYDKMQIMKVGSAENGSFDLGLNMTVFAFSLTIENLKVRAA